jgi:hypothetical protein
VNPPPFENEHEGAQEAAGILLLRVGLALLGEARLRGDFGEAAALAERAATLAAELNGGPPSPERRPRAPADRVASRGGTSTTVHRHSGP